MVDAIKVRALQKRCQVGCGGPRALDDAHGILADCYGTLGALLEEVEQLRKRLPESGYRRVINAIRNGKADQ